MHKMADNLKAIIAKNPALSTKITNLDGKQIEQEIVSKPFRKTFNPISNLFN